MQQHGFRSNNVRIREVQTKIKVEITEREKEREPEPERETETETDRDTQRETHYASRCTNVFGLCSLFNGKAIRLSKESLGQL